MSQQNSVLAHQFDDLAQQRESAELGMWAFLTTEIMFFGAVITSFIVYRITYREGFAEASHHLKFWFGTINTGVLLLSSFTVVLSVAAAADGNRRQLIGFLLATIGLGIVFLCIKGTEYYLEYKEGLVPHFNFTQSGPHANQVNLFMRFYFILTGIHATHMLVGIGIFSWVAFSAWRGRFSAEYYNPVEIAGLYWHFVDIVWIFLFPLLYLLHYS